jgi:uncharacterized protein YbjT (DUF2867 family)
MSNLSFLVTGATGATGGYTVAQLLDRGHHVRALAHRQDDRALQLQKAGAEVVFGDLLSFDDVRSAMSGMRRAYFCFPIRPGILQATAYFAQAAKESGIDGIVNMSQISARADSKSNAARDHWLSERLFDWSGLNVAHIRPTYFAEWLLYVAPMIKAGVIHWPFNTAGRHAPIAAEDQARVIVGILENPETHRGKVYPLFGPLEMTPIEITETVERVLGKALEYQQVNIDASFKKMAAEFKKAPAEHTGRAMYGEFETKPQPPGGESCLVQHLKEVAIDHQNGIFAGTNDVVQKIGGQPPMTVEQFVEKHRAAFV